MCKTDARLEERENTYLFFYSEIILWIGYIFMTYYLWLIMKKTFHILLLQSEYVLRTLSMEKPYPHWNRFDVGYDSMIIKM